MGKIVVVWQQEMNDGSTQVLDTTFGTMDEALVHVKKLKEDAKTLDKPFKLLSINDMSNKKITPNKAHTGRKKKGKGSGWKGESRRHSLAKKGVKTGKRR